MYRIVVALPLLLSINTAVTLLPVTLLPVTLRFNSALSKYFIDPSPPAPAVFFASPRTSVIDPQQERVREASKDKEKIRL